jgi:hypothetical protein
MKIDADDKGNLLIAPDGAPVEQTILLLIKKPVGWPVVLSVHEEGGRIVLDEICKTEDGE